jgi:hypothetical protein
VSEVRDNRPSRLAVFGTPEAEQEVLRAEQDIRGGRYETIDSFDEVDKFISRYTSQRPANGQRSVLKHGELAPGAAKSCPVTSGEAWTVEFMVNGAVVASATVDAPQAEVVLVEHGGGFSLEIG